MRVDFTGWKSGDDFEVVVRGKFISDGNGYIMFAHGPEETKCSIGKSVIKSITRIEPPIKVGDRVGVKNGGGQMGTVKAYDDGRSWVLWDDGVYITYPETQLERIA